ncbi:hypothetical protein BTN50_0182 [Candidatus Enterovibrio altilux]|uniref:Mobile element protein n=1 Tax=Candidatus Enterovibrio altilux TaxID=1927128 RepID=A0A291B6V3_9GAMM|nr:hypothetical protein BTN50_0182 [Candidatus Enterovibrio luxaltus]
MSKRVKTANVTSKAQNKGSIQHLAINSTKLKVYSEEE